MTAVISIRAWERFQHYKDRSAPWVKLHRDMLTSESWVLGSDLSRVVQLASMMLAPRYGNQIPYRFDLCKKVMSLDCTEAQFTKAIQHLIETEFLEIQELPGTEKPVEQSASSALAKCSSEERENRGEREGEKNPPPPQGGAIAVFDHWRIVFSHPKSILDDKRRRLIDARLKQFSVDNLRAAIDGYKLSPFHQGENKDGKVFDSIELIMRDAQHVEEGMRFLRAPPRPPPKVDQLSPVERVLRANGVTRDDRVVSEQARSSNGGLGDVDADVRPSSYQGFRRLGS